MNEGCRVRPEFREEIADAVNDQERIDEPAASPICWAASAFTAVLAAGAIASAFSPDIWWLIGFRIILGVGIGGDYPVIATLMSEFSGKKSRGMMVSLVFATQAAGLIVGPLLAAAFLASGLPKDLVWRLLLALGAVPALAVFHMRRHMEESPRYLLARCLRTARFLSGQRVDILRMRPALRRSESQKPLRQDDIPCRRYRRFRSRSAPQSVYSQLLPLQ
jgi:MFS family permease